MDSTTAQFVARMRTRRRELGLTQDQLARRCDVPTTTITYLESGRRKYIRFSEALAIAQALDMDVEGAAA